MEWREKLDLIGDMLTAIRRRLKMAKEEGAYSTSGNDRECLYWFNDRSLGKWFDSTRKQIISILSSICEDMGKPRLRGLRNGYRW